MGNSHLGIRRRYVGFTGKEPEQQSQQAPLFAASLWISFGASEV